MKTYILFGIMALAASATAHSDTRERVISITTNAFAGNFAIDVVRDASGTITQMHYQTPTNSNGVLTPAQLAQGPQVIYTQEGHDAILMSTESDFTVQKGGHMNVRFLHNGIDGSYIDFRVMVTLDKTVTLSSDPNPNDPDSDNNTYTGVFNRLYLEKNTVFGATVGIDQIVPSEQ